MQLADPRGRRFTPERAASFSRPAATTKPLCINWQATLRFGKMDAAMIVLIFALCGLLASGGVPATLPVTLQAFGGDRLATGSTFELLCVALFADEETMVKWSRERPAADGVDEPPTSIGNNDMLDERFRKSNRYRMTGLQREESDVFDITLRIEDARVEDSGVYRCGLATDNPADRPGVEITITAPITRVSLMVTQQGAREPLELRSGDSVQFDGGERCRVECRVDGGYPPAAVTISVGDEDITTRFVVTPSVVSIVLLGGGGAVERHASVVAVAEELTMEPRFANKQFRCSATVPLQEDKATAFRVEFRGFMPMISCEKQVLAVVGDKMNITCMVRAQPAASDLRFVWPLAGKRNATLRPGQKDGHYRAEQHQDGDHVTRMSLIIDRIGEQMFRKHYFIASNSFGVATRAVLVMKDPSRPAYFSGATITTGGFVVLIVTALHALLRI